VIGILQTFGKNQGGKLATKGCLRHRDPLLDVQSALGRYFVTRFTLGGEAFPNPCSREFLTVKIWPGRKDFSSSLSYGGHRARFAKVYKALDIKIKKVTHAPRYHTVRKADEAGLDEEVGNGGTKNVGKGKHMGVMKSTAYTTLAVMLVAKMNSAHSFCLSYCLLLCTIVCDLACVVTLWYCSHPHNSSFVLSTCPYADFGATAAALAVCMCVCLRRPVALAVGACTP
jgi:hypothetical protein